MLFGFLCINFTVFCEILKLVIFQTFFLSLTLLNYNFKAQRAADICLCNLYYDHLNVLYTVMNITISDRKVFLNVLKKCVQVKFTVFFVFRGLLMVQALC